MKRASHRYGPPIPPHIPRFVLQKPHIDIRVLALALVLGHVSRSHFEQDRRLGRAILEMVTVPNPPPGSLRNRCGRHVRYELTVFAEGEQNQALMRQKLTQLEHNFKALEH